MSQSIPQPPTWPIVGNVSSIDPLNFNRSLSKLADEYGEIFKLTLYGVDSYTVNTVALVNEVCDERRFKKAIDPVMHEIREAVGDGLFTAFTKEHNWGVAHRVLTPAFGPMSIKNMFDEMYDIASQLVIKWARNGPNHVINASEDFTRLTLDSIALCAMDKRFNSFYKDELHPFVGAMADVLLESGVRGNRSKFEGFLNPGAERKFFADIKLMRDVAQEVLEARRNNPNDKKDLLNAMLHGKDPKTGEKMTDESIINNMITFLIAGHETTSGLLSLATYFLLANPDALRKAQQEVDEVVGHNPVAFEHMSRLPYLEAVLRETLRLVPTGSGFIVEPVSQTEPTLLAGKYLIPPGGQVTANVIKSHLDPSVYGEDSEEFNPERMTTERFKKLPSGAWKPFGNGARGCIGRAFAWQESLIALATILQNFDLHMADPSYELKIKETLTLKPDGFGIKVSLRHDLDPIYFERKLFAGLDPSKLKTGARSSDKAEKTTGNGPPITILFGSNSGTCNGFAQTLSASASKNGLRPTVKPLDEAVANFPKDHPVIIITASYEGEPPDNAKLFVDWLKSTDSAAFKGSSFAVFGCGHKDWVATYQKVPQLIESELEKKGSKKIVAGGATNVADGKYFEEFENWTDELWAALEVEDTSEKGDYGLDVNISTASRATNLQYNVHDAIISKNYLLTAPGAPEKRHVEVKLPSDLSYDAGDYIAVLPVNNPKTIGRVFSRFGLPEDATMTLAKGAHSTIPTEHEVPIGFVLSSYVELKAPATRKTFETLSRYAGKKITGSGSILEVLEANRDVKLPFGVFLSMLPPLRMRQYSISSSPLRDPKTASMTFSLYESGNHIGAATSYLQGLRPGANVQVAIKKSPAAFHLPVEESTPIIMICAGSGLAPFRGFVQERAAKIKAGKKLGEAYLFIGCRSPDEDKLYSEEFKEWEDLGAVKTFYAFSRKPEESEGCRYVQDRVLHERAVNAKLFDEGVKTFICGSSKLSKGITDVVAKIVVADGNGSGKKMNKEEAVEWWEGLRGDRYAVDVFD